MTLSELIRVAQEALEANGDMEVAVNSVPIEYSDEYVYGVASVKEVEVTTDSYECKRVTAFVVD